ncbi:MAG: hypothetical protein OJF52_003259 [Nitrospira sp.]|jgi:hypothetical protein|nr:MAG: hypothetical protein OJF52_003259 [Nitrospira sp.]
MSDKHKLPVGLPAPTGDPGFEDAGEIDSPDKTIDPERKAEQGLYHLDW